MSDVATMIDTPHLAFDSGLPGFPQARTFVLMHTDLARDPFSIMKCLEDDDLEFVVVPPQLFFPDYVPVIDSITCERVGVESSDDALLLAILTVGDDVTDITANLLGPIVVNRRTNVATQVVLSGQDFAIRQPLFPNTASLNN